MPAGDGGGCQVGDRLARAGPGDPGQGRAGGRQQPVGGQQPSVVGQLLASNPHQHRVVVVHHQGQAGIGSHHPQALGQGRPAIGVLESELAGHAIEAGVGKRQRFHAHAGMEADPAMPIRAVPIRRHRRQVHRIDLQRVPSRLPQQQWQRAVAGGQVQHARIRGQVGGQGTPEAADRTVVVAGVAAGARMQAAAGPVPAPGLATLIPATFAVVLLAHAIDPACTHGPQHGRPHAACQARSAPTKKEGPVSGAFQIPHSNRYQNDCV